MNAKHILLLHEDRILTHLFREKLQEAGFSVDSAPSGEAGLAAAAARPPDAVVLDPILPGPDLDKLIVGLRASGSGRLVPVVTLATGRPAVSDAAQRAGADVVLTRGANPVADVIDSLQTHLGLERTAAATRGLLFRADERFLGKTQEAAPEALKTLRRALHEVSREGGDPVATTTLLQTLHGLAEQFALLGHRPLYCFAAQMESMAFEMSKFPEMSSPSVLRTLGQAIDFLASLLPPAIRSQLKDPAAAHVLIVDDEEGARKIMMAAMRLANLKSMAADKPSTSLSALGVQGFDLIFLDVGLPEMSGFDLCTRIRALSMHRKTPIIFITGMVTFQNRVQSNLSGGNDFVGKPFSLPELGLKALIWLFKGQLRLI